MQSIVFAENYGEGAPRVIVESRQSEICMIRARQKLSLRDSLGLLSGLVDRRRPDLKIPVGDHRCTV